MGTAKVEYVNAAEGAAKKGRAPIGAPILE